VENPQGTRAELDLRAEVIRLGPWHLDVEINPELSTRAFLDAPKGTYDRSVFGHVTFRSAREGFVNRMARLYPDGLQGRSVLDCACNCGAYLFWAKELGAGDCFGFDVRSHWIEQARFLARHRSGPGDDIRFEVRDLYDLPDLGLDAFDITLFNGILYHLPDPIHGLKVAADLTKELLVVNSATRTDLPDGMLVAAEEGRSQAMSGVYGMNWFPTGPNVIASALGWSGFEYTRPARWRRAVSSQPDALGRIEVLGAREDSLFATFDQELGRDALVGVVNQIAQIAFPPGATVAVASRGDDRLIAMPGRSFWHFPQLDGGAFAADLDDSASIVNLEELRERGAEYLLVPAAAPSELELRPALREHVENHCRAEFRELGVCDVYSLRS
jgi:tRNA (mo5U34)-methyltransferase